MLQFQSTKTPNYNKAGTIGGINHAEKSSTFLGKTKVDFSKLSSLSSPKRKTVLVGSSTLSHIWKCNTLRSSVPLNMHFLIGGTVVEIHRMFLKEYGSSSEPLNVIFSCAINSIPLESAQQIITQMKCFNYSVKQLNKNNTYFFNYVLSTQTL